MNTAKLKSVMVLHGDTGATLAEVIGISAQTFSAKLNGKDGSKFDQNEMGVIKKRYNLTPEEVDQIFLSEGI